MVKLSIRSVKAVALESGLILAIGLALALMINLTGLDVRLAQALYDPTAAWAWVVRQWSGLILGVPVVLGGLFLLLAWPKLIKKYALWHHIASVMVLAVVLGMGLISQVLIQDLADRARPRDSVLTQPGAEMLHGHSMPSGHAAMGFAFVAPYFLLRRKKPRAAKVFLAFGLLAGGFIGYSRMVLGAHYLTDVGMAGVIALACGPWWAWGVSELKTIQRRWWWGGVAIALAALVLGNKFTLSFSQPVGLDFSHTMLPCPLEVSHDATVGEPMLDITLTGYGAPVSQIYPVNRDGVVTLRKWGLYHGLACRAVLRAPELSYD